MMPDCITFHFCFDNINLPPENSPVLCIFTSTSTESAYAYCSLISNLSDFSDKFWVKHNSLEKSRVYPFAWISMPNDIPDTEFLKLLQERGQLYFKAMP